MTTTIQWFAYLFCDINVRPAFSTKIQWRNKVSGLSPPTAELFICHAHAYGSWVV